MDIPITMRISWDTKKISDMWSYEIRMSFYFDNYPEKIENEVLTELGVYKFVNKNECQVQAKRACNDYKSYFSNQVEDLIMGIDR